MVGLKFSKKIALVLKLFKLYLFDMSIIFTINFDTIFFLNFLILKERKRLLNFNGKERKLILTVILTIKIISIYVNGFHLIR